MRFLHRGSWIYAAAIAAAAMCQPQAAVPAEEPEPADLVLLHGHIRTSGGWADALAVRKGVIVAVGDDAAIQNLRGSNTAALDLAGDTVLPGLHDVHVHPLYAGLSERQCRIAQGSSLKETQAKVAACVRESTPGAWITGGQWDASALGRAPDRKMLDPVAPSNPVLLEDTSGHSSWANSQALANAHVTRSTPNPPGGIIERDRSGEPTGVLRESAIDLVKRLVPAPTQEEANAALAWSLRTMLAQGITSYTEAAVGFSAGAETELRAYAALADAGVLKQRARLCLTWTQDQQFETVLAERNLFARPRVSPDCVKIFLDGVPTDSHTAAMLEPYVGTIPGRSDEAALKGLLLVDQPKLDAAVTRFDGMGLTVKFHAAGDAAVRAGLNAIEAARRTNGFSAQMHNVGHCTFVAPEDIARARAIGATFEVSPYLWGPSPINDDIAAAVGPATIERVWPVREMIDSGALVVPGSDWSVVPSVSPWIGIETLVTRERPGGSDKTFGKREAIELNEAVDLFTRNAAREEGTAAHLGRLEAGMDADFIVLDRNPYAVPVRQVHETVVRKTFIAGELVYDADTPAAIAIATSSSVAPGGSGSEWLMVVKTLNTDPAREVQFNKWYDRIDVPDVLAVPGYMRARRGVKVAPDTDPNDGQYVAVYNMRGASIDKIIIDMLMATLKMDRSGRSTDLLKVTERVYYREHASPLANASARASGAQKFFAILRNDCCSGAASAEAYDHWYNGSFLPELLRQASAERATRYELYRVLMFDPHPVPRYLTIVELHAASSEEAQARLQHAIAALEQEHPVSLPKAVGDLHVYRQIGDVLRAGTGDP